MYLCSWQYRNVSSAVSMIDIDPITHSAIGCSVGFWYSRYSVVYADR